MSGKLLVPLLAVSLATTIVVWALPARPVAATGGEISAFDDADSDFVPDVVEWTMLSSSVDPDTDGDSISDFVELLQASDPRVPGVPLPDDQQMRLVVTGPSPTTSDPLVWTHVFFRIFDEGKHNALSLVQSFAVWLEVPWLPGIQISLDAFATGLVEREHVTIAETWVQISIPMVPPSLLLALGECTIWAEALIGGHPVASGMKLVPMQGDVLALVPFGESEFVLQPISPSTATDGPPGPNRVCVLDLQATGSGPAGTQYLVIAADCEDANELECAPSCLDSVGSTITIPGGSGLIGGN